MIKQLFKNKTARVLTAGILILSLLALSGCSTNDHQALPADQQRKPFIPPADHLVTTGYQPGTDYKGTAENISLMLDNTKNGFHVKAALFKTIDSRTELIAVLTIRKGEQFTIRNLAAGKYEVQFQNLYTGKYFKLNSFFIDQDAKSSQVPLYQIDTVNSDIYPIPRANF